MERFRHIASLLATIALVACAEPEVALKTKRSPAEAKKQADSHSKHAAAEEVNSTLAGSESQLPGILTLKMSEICDGKDPQYAQASAETAKAMMQRYGLHSDYDAVLTAPLPNVRADNAEMMGRLLNVAMAEMLSTLSLGG